MKAVFRVEDSNGKGPYGGKEHTWNKGEPHSTDNGRPSPMSDLVPYQLLGYGDDMFVFGFSSMQKLLAWFTTNNLEELYKMGFSIKLYRVPDYVFESDTQVVFESALKEAA